MYDNEFPRLFPLACWPNLRNGDVDCFIITLALIIVQQFRDSDNLFTITLPINLLDTTTHQVKMLYLLGNQSIILPTNTFTLVTTVRIKAA